MTLKNNKHLFYGSSSFVHHFIAICEFKLDLNWWIEFWPLWKFIRPKMGLSTKFELNPINSLSANAWKMLDQPEARKLWEFSGAWPKVNKTWGGPQWVGRPNLMLIWSTVYLQMAGNWRKFIRAWLKVNQAGKGPNKFAHQISAQSEQRLVWKWTETAPPIRGQEMVGIQWCVTKIYLSQGRPVMSLLTKF